MEKIERLLQTGDLLDLEDEELSARLETFFQTQEERDRQISETLKNLLAEVDDLLVLSDDLELLDSSGR